MMSRTEPNNRRPFLVTTDFLDSECVMPNQIETQIISLLPLLQPIEYKEEDSFTLHLQTYKSAQIMHATMQSVVSGPVFVLLGWGFLFFLYIFLFRSYHKHLQPTK